MPWIYESPDGGKTIYRRRINVDRTLVTAEQLAEESLWEDIIKEARTNNTLQDAIERVKIIYYLSKNERPIKHQD